MQGVPTNFTTRTTERKDLMETKKKRAVEPEADEKAEKSESEDAKPTEPSAPSEPSKKLKTWCLPEVKEWTLPPEVHFLTL